MTRSELIAALEKVTEPSRKLDLDIYLASNGLAQYEQVVWHGTNPVIRYYPGPPDAEYRGIRRYTASIDAALTLVPDNAFWSLSVPKQPDMSGKRYWASLHAGKPGARGATPAIALCIAALKAMEATDDRR